MIDFLPKPDASEYDEWYERYISLVPDGNIIETLTQQMGESLALLQGVPEELERHRYAPEKWSVREVVGHLVDVERMMTYRAMHFARADGIDMPGMDPDEWGGNSNADKRPLHDLAAEWAMLRRATVHFFQTLGPEAGERTGTANGKSFTVRTFPWIIAGHERWHLGALVRDYGVGAATT